MTRREAIEDLERRIDYHRPLPAARRLALVRARNRLQAEERRDRMTTMDRQDWVARAIRMMTAAPPTVRGDADAHVHEHRMAAMGYRGDRAALEIAANRAEALAELLARGDVESARRIADALALDLRLSSTDDTKEDGPATQETPEVLLHGKAV